MKEIFKTRKLRIIKNYFYKIKEFISNKMCTIIKLGRRPTSEEGIKIRRNEKLKYNFTIRGHNTMGM